MSGLRRTGGQSSIEMLGVLPLLATLTVAVAQLLAAGVARSAASSAAEAAAMAIVHGTDPTAAARAAAPSWSHARLDVRVTGRRVRVRITPPALVPGTAGLLATTAEADAGPAPTAAAGPPPSGLARAGGPA